MTVVKITVLETSLKKDLADEYAVPNLEPCPVLKAGQVFYATNTCPKGMCDAAWRTINQYVFALACGVREFYGGGWMKERGGNRTPPLKTPQADGDVGRQKICYNVRRKPKRIWRNVHA